MRTRSLPLRKRHLVFCSEAHAADIAVHTYYRIRHQHRDLSYRRREYKKRFPERAGRGRARFGARGAYPQLRRFRYDDRALP